MSQVINLYYDLYDKHNKEKEDTLVMMQIGSFYESYESQEGRGCATKISKLLNMNLTRKNKNKEGSPYMCGFPMSHLQKHLSILNDKGYRVAIYEQDEHTASIRKLKGIYTPNIRLESDNIETTSSNYNNTIFCYMIEKYPVHTTRTDTVYEYMEHYCMLEMQTGKIYLGESMDNDFSRMIEQFFTQNNPKEILFYTKNLSQEEILIVNKIISKNNMNINVEDWVKDEQVLNEQYIENYEEMELYRYSEMPDVICKILKYLENHDSYYLKKLFFPENCWIDNHNSSILQFNRDLFRELFLFSIDDGRNFNINEDKKKTVYDILSKDMNLMAKRYFKKILQHPMTDIESIRNSYKKIENNNVKKVQKQFLKDIIDVEWYYLRWKRENLNFKCLGNLLYTYKKLEDYYPQLSEFNQYIGTIWDINKMKQFPDNIPIYEDYILDNIELKNKIQQLYTSLEDLETEDMILFSTDNIENYYFEIKIKKWNKMSKRIQENFRIIDKNKTNIKVMSHLGDSIRLKIEEEYSKLQNLQKQSYAKYYKLIMEKFDIFFKKFHEKLIDDCCYVVLKDFFQKNGYNVPKITENKEKDSFCNVKDLRHCIIEYISPNEIFVPFSFEIDKKNALGSLIYGMNSSGKSTFMKSLGIGLWLAQCGLYVPASEFEFYPFQRIYSKFSHNDNLYCGHSLFVSEMSELDYILKHSGKNTLLLLDELTSGTEIHSSSSLTLSIIEAFVKKTIYFCFTTHTHWIAEYIKNNIQSVKIYHFLFDTSKDIKKEQLLANNVNQFYNRFLNEGSGPLSYGIEVAEQLGIDPSIIKNAKNIRNGIHFFYQPVQDNKFSKYNSKLNVKECFSCKSHLNLHTHHILPQEQFNNQKQKNGFRKNALYNLVVLCENCHTKTHSH
jgi:DNA mismatch repair protein MutS